jgi:hypothetical protein
VTTPDAEDQFTIRYKIETAQFAKVKLTADQARERFGLGGTPTEELHRRLDALTQRGALGQEGLAACDKDADFGPPLPVYTILSINDVKPGELDV